MEAYRKAPGVVSAEPWREQEKRPAGVLVRLASGATVRHAITRVRPAGEDLGAAEEPATGAPPEPVEPTPEPGGPKDRKTAAFLAAALAGAGNEELAEVYVYGEGSQHPGLGAVCHSGAKIHMLLS